MFMKDDKKKHISLIIKRMKGTDGMNHEEMENAPQNEYGDEMESSAMDHAVEAMMNAFHSRNKSDFKSALKSFIQMTYSESEEKQEEE